jgi:hypothetical protein
MQRRDLTAARRERPGARPSPDSVSGTRGRGPRARVSRAINRRFAIDAKGKERELSGFFNTAHSRDLLAIRPPEAAAGAGEDRPDSLIYAAFNRVIHRRSGRPAQNRFGSGVRRVEISLTP